MKEVIYFMWKDKKHAKITYDYETREVEVENYVDDIMLIPFGINKNPDFKDFEEFIEDRVLPRTRFDLKHVLDYLNIPYYDPWEIIKVNHGLQFSDYGWLLKDGENIKYDDIKIRD